MILSGVVFMILMMVASTAVITRLDQINPQTALLLGGGNILAFVMTVIVLILMSFPLFGAAEVIQIFMDIENNQREQLDLLEQLQMR